MALLSTGATEIGRGEVMSQRQRGAHAGDEHHEPGFVAPTLFSTDHKMIGKQFLASWGCSS
jgi:hypothetical protein